MSQKNHKKNHNERIVRHVVNSPKKKKNKSMYGVILIITFLSFISIFLVYLLATGKWSGTKSEPTATIQKIVNQEEYWWNNTYKQYKRVSITNKQKDDIFPGSVVGLQFDHATLVKSAKSLADGKDVTVVYLNTNHEYEIVPFTLKNPNTQNSLIEFTIETKIPKENTDSNYFIYYTDTPSSITPSLSTGTKISADQFSVLFSEERTFPMQLSVSRKWVLQGGSGLNEKFKSSIAKVQITDNSLKDISVGITNSLGEFIKTVPMVKNANGQYEYDIKNLDLTPGEYSVVAKAEQNKKAISTSGFKIYVSQPLYLNWSIDWEGEDADDKSLAAMESISTAYAIPITHYFNARIYMPTVVQPVRSKYLTQWVLQRQSKGDEIGMHMHMWVDMVKQTGVSVRTQPTWSGGTAGHDIPATAYTAEEFDTMVKWSKAQFASNNLPVPTIYRAGGWQINAGQLGVLAQNGFIADTSGRNFIKFGTKQYAVPWSLDATAKPYKPSKTDINKPGTPEIGIWEFPNNNESSSNYGSKSTKLIDTFKMNYTSGVLKEKQTLSFLSHAQRFNVIDEALVRSYLDQIKAYKADSDSGPLVFTTISKVLPEYQK